MHKKLISTVVTLVFGFGMIMGIAPVRAADAPAPAIGQAEAALLKQTLDVLSSVLMQIQSGISSSDTVAANAATFASVLGGIRSQLVALDSTLKGESIAIVETPKPVAITLEIPPVVVAVTPQPAPQMESKPQEPVVVPESPMFAAPPDEETALDSSLAAETEESAEAAVGSVFGSKAPIGIAIAAILVLGVGLYLWLKRDTEDELEVEPVREQAMMIQKPLPGNFDRKIADSSIDL